MRKRLSAVAVVSVVGWLLVGPAGAEGPATSPIANGRRCGLVSSMTRGAEGETQQGLMDGGPITAASAGATISIACSIQIGAANSTHAGADSVTASSAATRQVATLPPMTISFPAPAGQPVYQCTQVTINGTTYYWDATVVTPDPIAPRAVGWSLSSSALCDETVNQEIVPGPFTPVLDILAEMTGNRTPVYAVIQITKPLLGSPVVTDRPDFHDSNWNCTTSFDSLHVACTLHRSPPIGTDWWCGPSEPAGVGGPWVNADMQLGPGGYVRGTASCGAEAASCTSAGVRCFDNSPDQILQTFTCDVERNTLALQWTVDCHTTDP